ncbi:MAG: hypothetical protein COV01_02735 [Candidatus Taylorbacteria bacterium CG10_big_fil_rev_8_21_14_0_10_41_48]|uniref:Uncharacterized protein n=1 Tax=Candidatus Taylorbacteria bacterium CG10_big_fil_rev_8_21_14_0_10_41_48 TaxID=1975024 RepID=A0A2M8LBL0_9BACT|nr:MAG: hypothetical protein COV01_02735 [Candidatus Taylorbacteria bacterium CG10_big_fil_rev_8_21_14_0_10_41_48]
MKKILIASFIALTLSLPFVGHAQSQTFDTNPVTTQTKDNNPSVPTQTIKAEFQNPLGGVNSLSDLFYKIVDFIIGLSYVVIAAFYLIAGFKFVKAQGNPEELSGAKRAFLNTTIGAIIIIGINVITQVIQSTIQSLQN